MISFHRILNTHLSKTVNHFISHFIVNGDDFLIETFPPLHSLFTCKGDFCVHVNGYVNVKTSKSVHGYYVK